MQGIVGFLLASLTSFAGASSCSETAIARSSVDCNGPISTAIKLFRMHVGRYPRGLEELTEKPTLHAEAEKWHGPYLEDAGKVKDPWGEEYRYQSPGQHHPDTYDLWSKGPDRLDGTADDVCDWQTPQSPVRPLLTCEAKLLVATAITFIAVVLLLWRWA